MKQRKFHITYTAIVNGEEHGVDITIEAPTKYEAVVKLDKRLSANNTEYHIREIFELKTA